MFESATRAGPHGRYDILFAHPQEALWKDREGGLHGALAPIASPHFLDHLDHWSQRLKMPPSATSAPFSGGWLVFLGYEMAAEAEPTLQMPLAPEAVAAFALRVPAAIVFDHRERRLSCVVEPGYEALAAEMARDIAELDDGLPPSPASANIVALEEETPERFLEAVRQAQDHIAAGDLYQANLSRLWRARTADGVQPAHIYSALRAANPAPFAASCMWKDVAILSSSPERLCAMRGGEISTRPIAGTRRRSHRPGADASELSGLIAHPKERAEHVMLIDLERNDLGRICRPGSVQVDEFMTLETYEHVHHIVSNVRGRLLEGVKAGEALRAVFPGGTITGCPKVRCMQLIAELEGAGRGAYTGSLGYLNRDGSGDFNILIRTMVLQDGVLTFRAGAGIVADSDPQRELEETRAKAEGLLRALKALA